MCEVVGVNKNSIPNAIQHTLFIPQEAVLENRLANTESQFELPHFTSDLPLLCSIQIWHLKYLYLLKAFILLQKYVQ